MKKRNTIIITSLIISIIFLCTGTFAYLKTSGTGNIVINAGELNLSVNNKTENFDIILKNTDNSKLKPGDSGSFNVELNASESSLDVDILLQIYRTDLPKNLKFYKDENFKEEYIYNKYTISYSENMNKTVTIYWKWNDLAESNDNEYMFKEIKAELKATINYHDEKYLYETLRSFDYTLDTNVDFTLASSETNGRGLMMMDETENDEYPILYYRGDVSNNNVIFGNFCWLIVRTTEKGGVKLIYNGNVNDDGSCNNYSGVGGEIATSNSSLFITNTIPQFEHKGDSPVYAGYMYNDTNKFFTHSEGWVESYDSDGVLDADNYILHLNDNTIDSETGRHNQNLKDSFLKSELDKWYVNNIYSKSFENLIEDTVWCNDRSLNGMTIHDYVTNNIFQFNAAVTISKNNIDTILNCPRDIDKFTVSNQNGNGDLTYSIGLLTVDELKMAGNKDFYSDEETINYLISISNIVTLSPRSFHKGVVTYVVLYSKGLGNILLISNDMVILPSLAITNAAQILSGNGSFQNPYLIST